MLAKMAARFSVDPQKMLVTLKSTAFKTAKGDITNEQMMALLVVADQYGLNPWTKEIFAFPDKENSIVPVVGLDGWARIINMHDQFDGMEFHQDDKSCTCTIYRKDRSHPTSITEEMAECRRSTGPWGSHPRRMLRHKAMIQCARLAFGYVGIYDQDEAERIIEKDITPSTIVVDVPQMSRTETVKEKLRAKKPPSQAQNTPSTQAQEDSRPTVIVPQSVVLAGFLRRLDEAKTPAQREAIELEAHADLDEANYTKFVEAQAFVSAYPDDPAGPL
ncbi:MAG: phage recombination protein Bet [Methylococcales bacterium]